jgi:hypothetical protein
VLEPPLLPPLALLLAGAELPPLGVLLALLDPPEEPPWLELVLAEELPPVDPLPPPESLVQDTTSAGRPTHKVAKSIFLIGEPPNRELRTGETRTSRTCESRDASIDVNPASGGRLLSEKFAPSQRRKSEWFPSGRDRPGGAHLENRRDGLGFGRQPS